MLGNRQRRTDADSQREHERDVSEAIEHEHLADAARPVGGAHEVRRPRPWWRLWGKR